MSINRKADNITLTFCNLCGSIVGGNGRMNLNISFDDNFAYNNKQLSTSISINICPKCATKLSEMLEESIKKTDNIVTDAKIRIGSEFNSLVTLDEPIQVKSEDEFIKDIIDMDYENEDLYIDDIEEDEDDDRIIYDEEDDVWEEDEKAEFEIPCHTKVTAEDVINYKLDPSCIPAVEEICARYTGTIKDTVNFIMEFLIIDNLRSMLVGLKEEQAIELIRKIIRDNTSYRLKIVGGKWYIHLPSYLKKSATSKESDNKNDKKRKWWTKKEDEILIANYDKGPDYCSTLLGRDRSACITRFRNLAKNNEELRYNKNFKRRFTKEEDEILLSNYDKGPEYCARLLNRSARSCTSRYRNLNRSIDQVSINSNKKWSDEEKDFLYKNYAKLGVKKCAKRLNRSVIACEQKYNDLKKERKGGIK